MWDSIAQILLTTVLDECLEKEGHEGIRRLGNGPFGRARRRIAARKAMREAGLNGFRDLDSDSKIEYLRFIRYGVTPDELGEILGEGVKDEESEDAQEQTGDL